eukprot:948435-Prorocentrum_lima.AAC.1
MIEQCEDNYCTTITLIATSCNRAEIDLLGLRPSTSVQNRSSRTTLQTYGHVVKAEECYEEAE